MSEVQTALEAKWPEAHFAFRKEGNGLMARLIPGWLVELIPRQPEAAGIVLVGELFQVDLPDICVTVSMDGHTRNIQRFRLDENGELAVRYLDNSLWEVGRTFKAASDDALTQICHTRTQGP